MKLKAIVPYFGGKRKLAEKIVAELGPHNSYFEPFCGSLAVLLDKPVVPIETVNDCHGDLINLAMVLASDHWEDLYQAVDRTLISEELTRSTQRECSVDFTPAESPSAVTEIHWKRAALYMALSWLSRNGAAGTARINYQIAVRWTQGGGSPGIRWRSAVDSVPAWHDRLKGVVIMRRDAFTILERIADEEGVAIYVDPPYFTSTRGTGGGSKYLYDFGQNDNPLPGGTDDHDRLANILVNRFKGAGARVVVSYYAHPRLKALYVDRGWTLRSVETNKNLAAQNKRGRPAQTKAPEVLLMNGPSVCADGSLF
jgi:DNA adenine methylase